MNKKNLPRLESYLPELTDFIDLLTHDVNSGAVDNWEKFTEKTQDFYTPARMQNIESIIPGWRKMASYSDGATLVHVTSALVALKQLPEYHRAAPIDQIICEWIVLLHDIDKEIHSGKRDHCHGFRSAVVASKILPGVGFRIIDDGHKRIKEWAEQTNSAIKPGVDGKDDIQDNQKLPEILSGIERIFGDNSPAAIIVKAILLHFSINTCTEWPQVAPLTDEEVILYIDDAFVPFLEIMMLVDSDAWALFEYEIKEKQRQETLFVFQNVRKLVKAS